ncbi:unnamed protein product [Caenorhabditis nigoni]
MLQKSRRRAQQVRRIDGQHSHDNGLAIRISVKIEIPKSTTFGQYAVTKRRRSSQQHGQSSHVICRAQSSTRSVKTTQVKQTVTTRRSTRPERSVKRVRFRNLLMTVVEVRMSSCKRILMNGYISCVSQIPEGVNVP